MADLHKHYADLKTVLNKLGGLAQRNLYTATINFHSTGWKSILGINTDITESDLVIICNNISLPNLKIEEDDAVESKNIGGVFKSIGAGTVVPENNTFSMLFYDTETSVAEEIFVPWIRHVINPEPHSSVYPFLRADIIVRIYSNDLEKVKYVYKLTDVYPNHVDSPNLDTPEDTSRSVGFEFNAIYLENQMIKSNKKPTDTKKTPPKKEKLNTKNTKTEEKISARTIQKISGFNVWYNR
jgi:hypothetical protein